MEERSIIAEIEGTLASGSADKQAEILRRVTDLFLNDADGSSPAAVKGLRLGAARGRTAMPGADGCC